MDSEICGQTSSVDIRQASDILKPTLHDNDFLQSFVRIDSEDCTVDKKKSGATGSQKALKNGKDEVCVQNNKVGQSLDCREGGSSGRQSRNDDSRGRKNMESLSRFSERKRNTLEKDLNLQKEIKGRRRQKNVTFRQEEVYTDKDRAAAVNMGSRDIIQSLKMKRRQDRNRELQIPDEAEPSAMLALAAREIRCGDVGIAVKCVNKALELSPNDKNALIARSKCHLLLGEPEKALQDAEAALNEKIKDPNNARAMYYKAEALYHLGDFELSLVYYYRGMKIRPEFDQFRLGVQKAKEAIRNILGNSGMPIPTTGDKKSVSKSVETRMRDCHAGEVEDRRKGSNEVREKNNNIETENRESDRKMEAAAKPEVGENKKNKKGWMKTSAPNLLGQLNIDKKYLEDLLKCPDIKAAHQTSAQHIVSHAEEGIAFLETRQEFWRQQRLTRRSERK